MFQFYDHFILIDKDLKNFTKSEILHYSDENFGDLTYFGNLFPLNGGEYIYF